MSPQITSSTGNSGNKGSFDSEDTLSKDQGDDSGEMSSPGTSRPDRKSKIRGRALSEHYAIDFITCTTTVDELDNLRASKPTVDEVKRLYQLKSSPKDVGWYYFQSSTKTRKPITDIPTGGGGGNWKKKFIFTGGPWGQVVQVDGKDYRVPPRFVLKLEPLRRVEAVLVHSCSGRELLTTYNLFESCLVSTDLKMEDVVIRVLNRKRPRPHAAKRDQNKDVPAAKRVNIAELVSKKDLEDFDGSTLGELVGAMQYNAFHLGCMATYYKAKVGRYDRKMREDIQSAKTKANAAEKKAGDLNLENLKLIERESLAQAKAITLEKELTKVKGDLQRQKVLYEVQLESLKDSYQHPDLKTDELAAGVAQYMDEEAAKEDVEKLEPSATEEGTFPPRAVLADVAEASTPPGATGETPLLLK
ncbi:uncharacterized protein LOC107174338 [Citrus sinensis]|uniref:uncharacterized protein LOC107174338 n=1 Tax=Citrus sinensis TaxID=2711 RepID=UPI0007637218|nr:uncharacterized protein LOC107174338 [Citrus sinensis]XP_024046679.1 uncharacterized protein LOC112101016 [Citrus x clementina]